MESKSAETRHLDWPSIAAAIARCEDARKRCVASGNGYAETWAEHLDALEKLLPHGSGIDCGTKIDRLATTAEKVVLTLEWHRMDSNGYYAGWYSYRVIVRPSFGGGLDIAIRGRNTPEDAKEYLQQHYSWDLRRPVRQTFADGVTTWEFIRPEDI